MNPEVICHSFKVGKIELMGMTWIIDVDGPLFSPSLSKPRLDVTETVLSIAEKSEVKRLYKKSMHLCGSPALTGSMLEISRFILTVV